MPATTPAQITLSFSRSAGLVAIAHGEQYLWAQTALTHTGFLRRDDGTYAVALDDVRLRHGLAASLVRSAHQHQAAVTTSHRPYIGDVADAIAAYLPGAWNTTVEVYSHPLWQEDLVPLLWDAGELTHAIQHERVPYAAVLKDGAGTELLLVERPGHQSDYLVGAFASEAFDDNFADPHSPISIAITAAPQQAARAINDRFLPAYHRALHARRVEAISSALERIDEEHATLEAMRDSGRYSDGVPLTAPAEQLAVFEDQFADRAWLAFVDVLTHAPSVLEQCSRSTALSTEDEAVLAELHEVLRSTQPARDEWNAQTAKSYARPPRKFFHERWGGLRARLGAQVMPAIATWVTEADAFARIARAATPGGQMALAAPAPWPAPSGPCPPLQPRQPLRAVDLRHHRHC
ncbi:hypothetical protein SSP35_22_00510 [Streptomyces sp. NBRC 110611]|uniref:hypothetical protein n=1 Tax=Streptomyces sp. NBRC 110611 TaxID=1621259 RepID=UPI00082A0C9F|nr:hypothetical protein [Streptomyces sp. NBRC 110611]GAU70748.1 hypothetical protein SSP35_22_00510 [Streptomyces sp. NBRC 110611]